MIDQSHGIVSSTAGSNYFVRILSTLNRELLSHGTQLKVNGGFINAGSQWNMGAPPRLGADRSKLKASHVDRALWSAQGFKGGQPYLGIHLHQAHRGSPTALWHCTGTLMQLGSHLRRLAGNQVHGIKHTSN